MMKLDPAKDSDEESDDDEKDENEPIRWSNLIFLPFHPVFKLIVLCCVIVKTTMGPIQAVYPIAYCNGEKDKYIVFTFLKQFYLSASDPIYIIDTFFHVLHRQITDEALRREFLPKSNVLIFFDVMSVIPFYRIMVSDICPPIHIWPNVLVFTEFITIYRITEYFNLSTTHSSWKIIIGFTILVSITVNGMTWFFILLTNDEYNTVTYDWRKFVMYKLNQTNEELGTYVYSVAFVLSFLFNKLFDGTKPTTIMEYFIATMLMIFGYIICHFVVFPKAFAESILHLRRICEKLPRVQRMIEETKRKNPNTNSYVDVYNFYSLMWKKRSGITFTPEIISELPRYLRLDIRQDLVWPVFYHSPTFRRTSMPFKRWICENIHLDYKLPNENFFAGPHCRSHLYYIRSGIVQFLSSEDGITPMLSVTSGTIFGDINFYIHPSSKKITVRCLTYCEVFFISRADILRGLHKFPDDRRNVFSRVSDRIKHARTLYTCKQHVRGLDRAEDEGIAWLKRRWWELSEAVSKWKNTCMKEQKRCELPPEEAVYHCSKYIGQLVLCPQVQLKRKSMFANVNFPWILLPNSVFNQIWRRVVKWTVFFVLIIYPPAITSSKESVLFTIFQLWTSLIYICDLCVALVTSVETKGHVTTNFASVMFARCKSSYFILDVLAAISLEYFVALIGKPEFYEICRFNKLIKIYVLFTDEYHDINMDPITIVGYKIVLFHFSFVYITSYLIYVVNYNAPDLTTNYFFGDTYCGQLPPNGPCEPESNGIFSIAILWAFRFLHSDYPPRTLLDIYVAVLVNFMAFLIGIFCKSNLVAVLYLKFKESTEYLYFVSNLMMYYKCYNIHPDMLKRLHRYLLCHWKFYKGMDVMNPNLLKDEPYDIYWKVHGEIAVKIIKESKLFAGANPALIKELAHQAKFSILPRAATLVLFGVQCKNVSWLANGYIENEFFNDAGEIEHVINGPGEIMSLGPVFFRKQAIDTAKAYTECEILYISRKDFYSILKRYPSEWACLENTINDLTSAFNSIYKSNMKKHRTHDLEILKSHDIHHKKEASLALHTTEFAPIKNVRGKKHKYHLKLWNGPDTKFIKYWMLIRTISVAVSILSTSLQGGGGAAIKWPLMVISCICDVITLVDIFINMFMPYYNDKGILIYAKTKCMTHYLSRGFLLDAIAALPWFKIITWIPRLKIDEDISMFINTLFKCCRIYILWGYFDYLADSPTNNFALISVVKWESFCFLLINVASQFMMTKCINFTWDDENNLVNMTRVDKCWLPLYVAFDEYPTATQLQILFAESLNLGQCGLLRLNLGIFEITRNDFSLAAVLFLLGLVQWYTSCYILMVLILNSRSSSLFQHAVARLDKFLHAERVEDTLIHKSMAHFSYWWTRTKGINIQNLMHKRIGVVYRQDLSYYFFKRTFVALDTLLKGGESIQRQLASSGFQHYFLPNMPIMREMDLNPWVFVIHRGSVLITENDKTIARLTKGAIFGQLDGIEPRPMSVTASTIDHVDVLQIPIRTFQDIINDTVRFNIETNPQSEMDFMELKKPIKENPYNTVRYLLRGRKTIQLPWMKYPMEAEPGTWYTHWLGLVWVVEPLISSIVVLLLFCFPEHYVYESLWILVPCDLIHLVHFISGFYTMHLIVVDNRCVNRHIKLRRFRKWTTYLDLAVLFLPLLTIPTGIRYFQMARLLRIRFFFVFKRHFCESFERRIIPGLMNFLMICLMIHAMTCLWIWVACRIYTTDEEQAYINSSHILTTQDNPVVDYREWTCLTNRTQGCSRIQNIVVNHTEVRKHGFLVPVRWQDDYVMALTFILFTFTDTDMNNIVPLTLEQHYTKIIIAAILQLMSLWVASLAIRSVYIRYRELYQYDYHVRSLLIYLKHTGLCNTLMRCVSEYTSLLWQRQKGNWLPELAQQAPQCLREDILGTLYLHHLENLPLFQQIPNYFTRQLAARFQRVVIFPGKVIVQEGDIFSCMYFIHEGDVEKWYTDTSGKKKMMTLLTTNGYFGLIPGLFFDSAYQFTYITRTVVDLVYLRFREWQDLLQGYPNVKRDLYAAARQLKKDMKNPAKM